MSGHLCSNFVVIGGVSERISSMIPSSICENREGPFDGRGIQVWKEGTAVMPIDVKYTTHDRATGVNQRNLGFQFFLLAAMLRASSAL